MSVINEQKSNIKGKSCLTFRLTLKYICSPVFCLRLMVVGPLLLCFCLYLWWLGYGWLPILKAVMKVEVLLPIIENKMVKKSSAEGQVSPEDGLSQELLSKI